MRNKKLDRLIYNDIREIKQGDNLLLSYTDEGFTELELESRLKYLSSIGVLSINEYVGQITVTAITQSGRDFFNSLPTE